MLALASLFNVTIVKSYNDIVAITKAVMLIMIAERAIMASYIGRSILSGMIFAKMMDVQRIASANNEKNMYTCSDALNHFLSSTSFPMGGTPQLVGSALLLHAPSLTAYSFNSKWRGYLAQGLTLSVRHCAASHFVVGRSMNA
eukprot:7223171-Ditylum_brightwellii.AAC.1